MARFSSILHTKSTRGCVNKCSIIEKLLQNENKEKARTWILRDKNWMTSTSSMILEKCLPPKIVMHVLECCWHNYDDSINDWRFYERVKPKFFFCYLHFDGITKSCDFSRLVLVPRRRGIVPSLLTKYLEYFVDMQTCFI